MTATPIARGTFPAIRRCSAFQGPERTRSCRRPVRSRRRRSGGPIRNCPARIRCVAAAGPWSWIGMRFSGLQGKNREISEKWPVFGCFQPEFLRVFNALSENKLVQEQGKAQPTTGKRGSGNRQPAMPARDSLRLRIGSAKRRHRGTFLLPPDRGLRPPAPAYSSKRLASSRSWPYRLASGNGGSQASRRTIQLS